MSLILEECIEFDEVRRRCTAEEKGKKFILINKTGFRIKKIRVDGCLRQQQNEKRCDYLINAYSPDITKGQKPIAFFIELKGGDLNRAVKQLIDSVVYLKSEFSGHILNARIIGRSQVMNLHAGRDYKSRSIYT